MRLSLKDRLAQIRSKDQNRKQGKPQDISKELTKPTPPPVTKSLSLKERLAGLHAKQAHKNCEQPLKGTELTPQCISSATRQVESEQKLQLPVEPAPYPLGTEYEADFVKLYKEIVKLKSTVAIHDRNITLLKDENASLALAKAKLTDKVTQLEITLRLDQVQIQELKDNLKSADQLVNRFADLEGRFKDAGL